MGRSSNLPVKLAVAFALAAMSGAAAAAAPTLKEVLDASGVTVSGYVSASYQYADSAAPVPFRVYDQNSDGFQVDQAALTIAFQPKEGFGGVVNVIAGEDARLENAFEVSRDVLGFDGTNSDNAFNLLQAYVQYSGSGFTAIAGKFLSLVGSEVIAPTGNFNFSRSLLFNFEPFVHTGARVIVPIGDTLQVIAGINNGFNNNSSSAGSKLGEVGLVYSPSKAFTLTAQGYFGKDRNLLILGADGQVAQREFANIVATWNVTDALTLVLTGDYQRQELLPIQFPALNGDDEAKAIGAAAYVNYKFTDQWRVAVRGEYFDDQDGFYTQPFNMTAGQQTVSEGTVTLGYAPADNYELRIEARYDMATDDIFTDKDGDASDNQTSFAFQALYKF